MPYPVMPLGFLGSQGDQDSYLIERSLRFNSVDTAYLERIPSVASNRKLFTLSVWTKICANFADERSIFMGRSGGTNGTEIRFLTTGAIDFYRYNGTSYNFRVTTTQLFRDPSAWYHFVFVYDSDQATASDRVKIYVNGVQITSFSTAQYPTLGYETQINDTVAQRIGQSYTLASKYDGYMAEINFIDGQALTPSSFGETDAITDRWKARAYSGTYGTNGFYLKLADNSGTTATTLGKDSSGNGNNWTPNNFSVMAGVGNDSVKDSPTNSGSSGNYCTWNPLFVGDTATNGNLDVTNDTARGAMSLLNFDSYWEITSNGGTTTAGVVSDGGSTFTTTVATGKVYGFRITTSGNLDYRNITDSGAWVSIQTGIGGTVFPYASAPSATTASLNAGQRDFVGAVPSGYNAICTTNLTVPTIKKPNTAMDIVTYTGNGTARSITGLNFSPDLVWIKGRSGATDHAIYDSVRGVQKDLGSNLATDETTQTQGLTAFNSNGFDIGTLAKINTSSATYVAWAWDESITDGLDIVSYTGNGANRTISHNLGVAPKMIIIKARTTAGADQGWPVYHASLANTQYLMLNTPAIATTGADYWNSTSPTASVFSLGTNATVNASNDTYVAYCFAEVEGFSRIGLYNGNASADGPFIYCGFRPKLLIYKRVTVATAEWVVFDSQRNNSNIANLSLSPSTSSVEAINANFDFVANGFKLRTAASGTNGSNSHVFAAFAESPFKYARAR